MSAEIGAETPLSDDAIALIRNECCWVTKYFWKQAKADAILKRAKLVTITDLRKFDPLKDRNLAKSVRDILANDTGSYTVGFLLKITQDSAGIRLS